MNSTEFANQPESEVREEELFAYKYFQRVPRRVKKKKKKSEEEDDVSDDDDEDEGSDDSDSDDDLSESEIDSILRKEAGIGGIDDDEIDYNDLLSGGEEEDSEMESSQEGDDSDLSDDEDLFLEGEEELEEDPDSFGSSQNFEGRFFFVQFQFVFFDNVHSHSLGKYHTAILLTCFVSFFLQRIRYGK